MANRVLNGVRVEAVSRAFGVSKRTVQRACREYDLPGRKHRMPKTFEILAELLKGERSQAEIAAELGASKQLVSWTATSAARAGIPIRVPDGRKRVRVED